MELLRTTFGQDIISADGAALEAVIIREAEKRGGRISLAESCTGGRIATRLTAVPGASAAFAGGGVVYSDDSNSLFHGVTSLESMNT